MTDNLTNDLYAALCDIPLIDPHSHIDPYTPVSASLDTGEGTGSVVGRRPGEGRPARNRVTVAWGVVFGSGENLDRRSRHPSAGPWGKDSRTKGIKAAAVPEFFGRPGRTIPSLESATD